MAKLTYKSFATPKGAQFNQVPTNDEVTKKEKQIIDFIEQQRQQTLDVRTAQYKGKEGVMYNEEENRDIIQNLKRELDSVRKGNTEIARDREVGRLKDLAKQAFEKSEFYSQWSKTLGDDVMKFGQGLWDIASYTRDKIIDNRNKKREEDQRKQEEDWKEESEEGEWGPGGQPPGGYDPKKDEPYEGKSFQNILSTDQLQKNAENSIHKQALVGQANLHDQGEFVAADQLMTDTFGRSAGTKWWGTYYGRQAASTFEQDWPTIVALADDGVDPSQQGEDLIRASYYKWLDHKGIALNSIAGKEVTKKFDLKLNALSNNRTQQILAAQDEKKSLRLTNAVVTALDNYKAEDPEELEIAFTNLMLHEARANKYIDGKFSPRGSRVINYGETFDSLVEPLLKAYNFSSFDEFKDKILSLQIIGKGDINSKQYINRPTYLKQRAHKLDDYEKIYLQMRDQEVKAERQKAKDTINAKIASHEVNPKYDPNTPEGRKALWAGLNSAESEKEKAWFGAKLSYDPKSKTSQGTHEALYRARTQLDWAEYNFHLMQMSKDEREYYEKYIEGVDEYMALQDAGFTSKQLESESKNLLNKEIGFKLDTHVISHYDADLHAKQRFHDINLEFKVKDYPNNSQRLKLVREKWTEEIQDPNGLWAAEDGEFIHFKGSHEYNDVKAPEMVIGKISLEELNKIKFLSTEAVTEIKKGIMRGDDNIQMPKILHDIWKNNPELSLASIYNGQLNNEEIDKEYDFKFTDKSAIKATSVDYLKAKAIDPLIALGRLEDVIPKSAWYDINRITKEVSGKNFVPDKVTNYLVDKKVEYKLDWKNSTTKDLLELGDSNSLEEIYSRTFSVIPIVVKPIN